MQTWIENHKFEVWEHRKIKSSIWNFKIHMQINQNDVEKNKRSNCCLKLNQEITTMILSNQNHFVFSLK